MNDLASLHQLALSNCSKEPIHIPGAIQSFGAVIAADDALECITHVSENIRLFLHAPAPDDILGQPLEAVLTGELVHDLRNVCGLPSVLSQCERLGSYDVCGQSVEVSVYRTSTRVVIELERCLAARSRTSASVIQVKAMIEQLDNPSEILSMAVQELRNRTGCDRVMAYRFAADGAGEVVAEARSNDMEPFLGLRYPASDIPDQAKALAQKTTIRVIEDVSSPAVLVLALDPAEPQLDLSLALTRRPSPIHIEYLNNMGVAATTTVAITVSGKLWGLFAFHHRQSKLLSADFRSMLALFSQLFSLRFQQVLAEEQFHDRKRTASSLYHIVSSQSLDTDWKLTVAAALPQLCQLLLAQGAAIVQNGSILEFYGSIPTPASVCALVAHSQGPLETDIVTLESLAELALPEVAGWGECAGALLLSLTADEPLYLVFFRGEVAREILWGGNPEKKEIQYGAFGPRLVPRASFEAYKEMVEGRCTPWNRHNVATALEIRTELFRLSESRMQLFQQRQQNLLISELNHRVRNILALIRSIARQTGESADSLTDYTQSLERRIVALATAHDFGSGHALEWPAIRRLLTIELQPYLAEADPRVTLIGPDVGFKASFVPTFVLVLHELVSNAAKYGSLSVMSGRLTVRWFVQAGGLSFQWKESNGPTVVAPQRRGFGRDLIERSIAYEFEGESTLSFDADGVCATFWIPSSLVRWKKPLLVDPVPDMPRSVETVPAKQVLGSVLVVEDNMLLAMEMERCLQQLGFEQIDAAPNVARAIALIEKMQTQQTPYRVGILDIELKKETSFEIAIALQTHKIPFVFVTGYDSKHLEVPTSLKDMPRLQKPIDLVALEKVFQTLIDL